jgi:GH18 family chitinase
MTYDFHGSWDQNRAHHSSLNSKDNEKDDTMYIVCTNDIRFVFHQSVLINIGFCCEIFSKIGYASQ